MNFDQVFVYILTFYLKVCLIYWIVAFSAISTIIFLSHTDAFIETIVCTSRYLYLQKTSCVISSVRALYHVMRKTKRFVSMT
jgi:hypothetical protein